MSSLRSSRVVFPLEELSQQDAEHLDASNGTSQKLLMVCELSALNNQSMVIEGVNVRQTAIGEEQHAQDNTIDQLVLNETVIGQNKCVDVKDSIVEEDYAGVAFGEMNKDQGRLNMVNEQQQQQQQQSDHKQLQHHFDFSQKRFQLVKKFVNKIQMFSPTLKFVNSTRKQLEKINDPSFQWEILFRQGVFRHEKPSLSQRLKYYIDSTLEKVLRIDADSSLVITPDSVLRRVWDIIQFVTILMNLVYLPISLAFLSSPNSGAAFWLCEVIPNIIQLANMPLELNTGFYKRGIVIIERKAILSHYIYRKFIFDFIVNICWIISVDDDESSSWFKAVGLLRMVVLISLIKSIEETFNLREILGSYFELLKLSGFIFISAHFCGCLWYALGSFEREIGVAYTWLDRDEEDFPMSGYGIDEKVNAYVAAFYWSIVTMCTVGYGDIGPTTYRERIFVIFIVLGSSFVFGFSMNQIGTIIQNLRSKDEQMKNTITMLNVYMKKRRLNKEMQMKVRRYYEYVFEQKNQDNEKGRQLIDDLAPCLREEVHKDIYTAMFRNQKMLSRNFSESFLLKLYRIVDERQCSAEENLCQEGQQSQELFFVLKGEVQLMIGSQCISEVTAGSFIGTVEFFSDKLHTFSAKTTQPTQIAVIRKKAFLELLQEGRREDLESFMQIKDNILSYQDSSDIDHVCESCGKHGHIFDNCKWIQFYANKHKQIYEFTSLKQITRQKWMRSAQKVSSLRIYQDTELSVKEYRQDEKISEHETDNDTVEILANAKPPLVQAGKQQQQQQQLNNYLLSPLSEFRSMLDSPQSVNAKRADAKKILLQSTFKQEKGHDERQQKQQEVVEDDKDKSPQRARWLESVRKRNKNRHATVAAIVVASRSDCSDFESAASTTILHSSQQVERRKRAPVDVIDEYFEKMHEFQKYFKKNNYSTVLQRINALIERNSQYKRMLAQRRGGGDRSNKHQTTAAAAAADKPQFKHRRTMMVSRNSNDMQRRKASNHEENGNLYQQQQQQTQYEVIITPVADNHRINPL